MKLLSTLHNYRYALWFLSIFFIVAVLFGPSDGSLGMTGKILCGLFTFLLAVYLILFYTYKRRYTKSEKENS